MAEVYLAEQGRLKRRVAVKSAQARPGRRSDLPAAVPIGGPGGRIAGARQYRADLRSWLRRHAALHRPGVRARAELARLHGPARPSDLPHALSIMRQVAAALAKAAEQGVVHRDIKPENIMLTARGEVKVADFGLARLTREGAGNDLTQVGITLGTPLYMSPEQVEGKPLDPRSDIYSFGVTCYYMLTGTPPFTAETALGVAVQHLKKQPTPLESLRPDLPPALCRLVHQMLAKDPAHRFATARDLLRELRRVQIEHFGNDWPEDLPAWDSLIAEMPPDPRVAATAELSDLMKTMARTRPRRRRWLWLTAGLVCAFLLGGMGAWHAVVPDRLLADAKANVPVRSDALRQYLLASQLGNEAAWQSVIDYFPEKKLFVHRAQQQLALIYLSERDDARALSIFESLAKEDELEQRAFGLAGKFVMLSLRKEYKESNDVLSQLLPIREKLAAGPMRQLVAQAIDRNRARLGPQKAQEWDQWFKDQTPRTKRRTTVDMPAGTW